MDYIVLDLEWNQCPSGKDEEDKELPFEIVEIGAVRLDGSRKYSDRFQCLVSPRVYRELHRITKDIIRLSIKELDRGADFADAMKAFLEWCNKSESYIFCTWGSMDLTELQRNCRYFNAEYKAPTPFIYYDVQKLYSLCCDNGKSREALETVVDKLGIKKDAPFHSAVYDAEYTARILAGMDFDKVSAYTSVDTFEIPKSRREEFTLNYGTYSKYVSRGFADRDSVMRDANVTATRCYVCNKSVRKKIRWFSANQKMYYNLGICEEHGYLKGKIKIRRSYDDLFYAVKILKLTDEAGAQKVRQRQISARQKRRNRRYREKEKLR
ncbi:MAG: exonuclease domain-containing protein [Butyrivibrio sp.]|nr:exonuclease domain-containing protein [Butyrivibrio sp.]